MFQQLAGNRLNGIRNGIEPRLAMWPFEGVVTLAGRGPVEFPDTCRVEVRRIDGDSPIREERVQGGQALLHELAGCFVVWEVHVVEQVSPVPRVRPDRFGESHVGKPCRYSLRAVYRGLVFLFGGGDPTRPDWVQVHREPPPAEDICIAGGRVFPTEPELYPVGPPGEEGRVDRV